METNKRWKGITGTMTIDHILHLSSYMNIEIFPTLTSSSQVPLYLIDDFPMSEFAVSHIITRSVNPLSYTFDDISFSRGGGGGVGVLSELSFILTNV